MPAQAPLRWPAEAIWEAVAPVLPSFTVEILPAIDSTNSELMRRFRASASGEAQSNASLAEPCLLVAEEQTAGRGRMGRVWQSRAGASLTFSVGLSLNPVDWSGLSLAVGLSLAESLDKAAARPEANPARVQLKWPNDLYLDGQKLGGILIETASAGGLRQVVIGVGINILPPTVVLDAAGSLPSVAPTSMQSLNPDLTAPDVLLAVAAPLLAAVKAFETDGFAPFQAGYQARDVLAGRAVQLSDGTQGVARGVNRVGALLVQTDSGMVEVTSAEVSVRPVAPPAASTAGAGTALTPETPSC